MKALILATLVLGLVLVPAPAQAQQSGALVVMLQPPTELLSEDLETMTLSGVVVFTADLTVLANVVGTPVSYTVTKQPAWASVIISPATDVFPTNAFVGASTSVTASRPIRVTVSLSDHPTADVTDAIEITAETSVGTPGRSFSGTGAAPIGYDAPDEPCDQHVGMTQAQMEQAAAAIADYRAQQSSPQTAPQEVTTQSAGEKAPVPVFGLAVVACALVGAAVGLALRRKWAR